MRRRLVCSGRCAFFLPMLEIRLCRFSVLSHRGVEEKLVSRPQKKAARRRLGRLRSHHRRAACAARGCSHSLSVRPSPLCAAARWAFRIMNSTHKTEATKREPDRGARAGGLALAGIPNKHPCPTMGKNVGQQASKPLAERTRSFAATDSTNDGPLHCRHLAAR